MQLCHCYLVPVSSWVSSWQDDSSHRISGIVKPPITSSVCVPKCMAAHLHVRGGRCSIAYVMLRRYVHAYHADVVPDRLAGWQAGNPRVPDQGFAGVSANQSIYEVNPIQV